MSTKEMPVLCREHFFDLLDNGHEEFRISATTPGKNKRTISEDAPFDRDDPMSYVLVNMIFDEIQITAKGEFSSHDIAESQRVYGNLATQRPTLTSLSARLTEIEKQLAPATRV